jgi:methionine synthase II (cobalamin-independent)
LFRLPAGIFYLQLASEPDRKRVLKIVREHSKPEQRIFVGVTDPFDPRVETPDEVRDRVLEAAEYIPVCAENLDSDVLVMQPANQGIRHNASDPLNWARDRRILGQ